MALPIMEWGMPIAEEFVAGVLRPYINTNQNKDD
jgi:hypothetical protein